MLVLVVILLSFSVVTVDQRSDIALSALMLSDEGVSYYEARSVEFLGKVRRITYR